MYENVIDKKGFITKDNEIIVDLTTSIFKQLKSTDILYNIYRVPESMVMRPDLLSIAEYDSDEYTDIILDLSELCQGLYYFLETSDCVYSMCARTKEEQFAQEQYKRQLEKRQMLAVLEQTKWMELPREWIGKIGNIERLTITPLGEYGYGKFK